MAIRTGWWSLGTALLSLCVLVGCTRAGVPVSIPSRTPASAAASVPTSSLATSPQPSVVAAGTPSLVHTALVAPAPTVAGDCGWTATVQTWIDANADGHRDDTEVPLSGVPIIVFDTVARRVTSTLRTDGAGHLSLFGSIGGCPAARFEVVADVPAFYSLTTPGTVTSRYPELDESIAFGYRELPSAGRSATPTMAADTVHTCGWVGTTVVWNDENGNGQDDAEEPPLADITVVSENRSLSDREDTVTDADGTASWYALFDVFGDARCADSRFEVYVEVPPGFRSTTPERIASAYPGIQPDPQFAFGLQRTP